MERRSAAGSKGKPRRKVKIHQGSKILLVKALCRYLVVCLETFRLGRPRFHLLLFWFVLRLGGVLDAASLLPVKPLGRKAQVGRDGGSLQQVCECSVLRNSCGVSAQWCATPLRTPLG